MFAAHPEAYSGSFPPSLFVCKELCQNFIFMYLDDIGWQNCGCFAVHFTEITCHYGLVLWSCFYWIFYCLGETVLIFCVCSVTISAHVNHPVVS